MAFNEQEQQIIQYGVKAGKSSDEIKNALTKLRLGLPPQDNQPQEPDNSLSAKGVAVGAAKGLGDTIKTTGDLVASSVASNALGPILSAVPQIKNTVSGAIDAVKNKIQGAVGLTDENLAAKNPSEKIGKGLEIAAEVASPFVAGKVAPLVKESVALTKEGATAARELVGGADSYVASRLPKALGIFSGESDDVIKQALRNPQLADAGIENGDNALRKVVQEGADNTIKIRSEFNAAHRTAKTEVLGQYGKILEPKNNIVGTFNKLLTSNGVKVGKDGVLDFTTSKIVANPGEVGKINAAYDALKKWDKFTLDSLDEYKQLVGSLTKFADEAGVPSKSPFLGKLYHELNQIAIKKLPKDVAEKYTTLNKNYSENIDMYNELVDAFNSGDPFTRLANSLGKNKDTLRQTLEFYAKQKGGQDVLPVVAGRELGMEKTASFGFLNPRSWVDLLISPKTQGKIITGIGKAAQ